MLNLIAQAYDFLVEALHSMILGLSQLFVLGTECSLNQFHLMVLGIEFVLNRLQLAQLLLVLFEALLNLGVRGLHVQLVEFEIADPKFRIYCLL